MLDSHFVIFGAALNLFGSTSYIVATLKGQTRPNRVSWFLWALAPLIAFTAEIVQHVGLRALTTFMAGFGPLMIFLASFADRKAYAKLTRLDWACGALSILALIFWQITRVGDVAIGLSIAADALAAVPTLYKAYREPASESSTAFLMGGLSASINLLTIKDWTFATYGFPLYLFLVCAVLFVLIRFPKLRPARGLKLG